MDKNEQDLHTYLYIVFLEEPKKITKNNVLLDLSKIKFTLSNKAVLDFPNVNHDILLKGFSDDFLLFGQCKAFISAYNEKFKLLNLFIICCRVILWLYIVIYFFPNTCFLSTI